MKKIRINGFYNESESFIPITHDTLGIVGSASIDLHRQLSEIETIVPGKILSVFIKDLSIAKEVVESAYKFTEEQGLPTPIVYAIVDIMALSKRSIPFEIELIEKALNCYYETFPYPYMRLLEIQNDVGNFRKNNAVTVFNNALTQMLEEANEPDSDLFLREEDLTPPAPTTSLTEMLGEDDEPEDLFEEDDSISNERVEDGSDDDDLLRDEDEGEKEEVIILNEALPTPSQILYEQPVSDDYLPIGLKEFVSEGEITPTNILTDKEIDALLSKSTEFLQLSSTEVDLINEEDILSDSQEGGTDLVNLDLNDEPLTSQEDLFELEEVEEEILGSPIEETTNLLLAEELFQEVIPSGETEDIPADEKDIVAFETKVGDNGKVTSSDFHKEVDLSQRQPYKDILDKQKLDKGTKEVVNNYNLENEATLTEKDEATNEATFTDGLTQQENVKEVNELESKNDIPVITGPVHIPVYSDAPEERYLIPPTALELINEEQAQIVTDVEHPIPALVEETPDAQPIYTTPASKSKVDPTLSMATSEMEEMVKSMVQTQMQSEVPKLLAEKDKEIERLRKEMARMTVDRVKNDIEEKIEEPKSETTNKTRIKTISGQNNQIELNNHETVVEKHPNSANIFVTKGQELVSITNPESVGYVYNPEPPQNNPFAEKMSKKNLSKKEKLEQERRELVKRILLSRGVNNQ